MNSLSTTEIGRDALIKTVASQRVFRVIVVAIIFISSLFLPGFSKWNSLEYASNGNLRDTGNQPSFLDLIDDCGNPIKTTPSATRANYSKTTKYCSYEHQKAIEFCSTHDRNIVEGRGDNYGNNVQDPDLRTYSLLNAIENREYIGMPKCKDKNDYLQSIKLGERVWTLSPPSPSSSNQTNIFQQIIDGPVMTSSLHTFPTTDVILSHEREKLPSRFQPHHCFAPVLPPTLQSSNSSNSAHDACTILNQYSHVIFHGDSLIRHVRQAIYMILRGDWISGAIPTTNANSIKHCVCDGQFSENKVCRIFDAYFERTTKVNEVAADDGKVLCANLQGEVFAFGHAQTSEPFRQWDDIHCEDPNYKGLLLVMNGGLHFKADSENTFEHIIEPVITHPKYRECAEKGKIRAVYVGLQSQSRTLDEKYPHQSRENTIQFNSQMRSKFQNFQQEHQPQYDFVKDILFVEWWNMTYDAPTSDGGHSLTDINLAKASQLLYLVERWPFPGKSD